MNRTIKGVAIATGLCLAIAAPATAQGLEITTVLEGGLDAPRGMAIGPDGTLHVAEAGAGGTEACIELPELGTTCFAATGGVSAIVDD